MKKAIEIEKRGTLNTQTEYVFETSTRFAPKSAPRTVASVLLERWAKDTQNMAVAMVHKSATGGWYALKMDNYILDWYKTYQEAIDAQIAYLNSAAEVEK